MEFLECLTRFNFLGKAVKCCGSEWRLSTLRSLCTGLSWIAFSSQTLWTLGDYVDFFIFFKEDRLHRVSHSWAATSLQRLHLLLRLTCITASQASQVHSAYTAIPLTTFLFIVSHSNLPQQHQWRIHIMNIIIKISESTLSGVLINSGRKHILTQTLVCLTSTHSQSLPHVHGISVAVECAMRQPMLWSLTLPSGAFKEAPLLSRYLTLLLLFHSTNTQAPITNWAADTH